MKGNGLLRALTIARPHILQSQSSNLFRGRYVRKASVLAPDNAGQLGYQLPRLSKQQVSDVLRMNEDTFNINHEAILRFENCKMAANRPIEDRHAEGYCNATDGYLFGVFDGHAGVANAQAVSERLFNYIAIELLSPTLLEQFCQRVKKPGEELGLIKFLRHNSSYFNQDFSNMYREAVIKYAHETLSSMIDWESQFKMQTVFENAFERLDNDFMTEAFSNHGGLNAQLLTIALSGCCALVAHIDGPHLHVASAGDCAAVLGTLNEDGSWSAKPLSAPHCVTNKSEKKRLLREHPNEKLTVIKDGRILGTLEPTRAFGDFRFKLKASELNLIAQKIRSSQLQEDFSDIPNTYYEPPQYYYTPPYVTAVPEVFYHHLRPKDKFLVLASDGLWNMFPSIDRVVQLVAHHIDGAQTIAGFQIPKDRPVELGELNQMLAIRKTKIAKRAEDSNCATHLIRNALGTTELGLSHRKLSAMLTLPDNMVRHYRDDITVTVVYFDEMYLKSM